MNTAQIKKIVHKLRISNNNIILLRKTSPTGEDETKLANEIAAVIEKSNLHDVFIIVVDDPNDLAVLDTSMMNKMGWYKKEQVLSLFGKVTNRPQPKDSTSLSTSESTSNGV